MKAAIGIICFFASAWLAQAADQIATKCVDTDSEIVIKTTDVIGSGESLLSTYPVTALDRQSKPVGLSWQPRGDLEASSEKVAVMNGKEIYRFHFWRRGGAKDGDGVVCVWFGIQAPAPSGYMGFRPFLVFSGDDQVRWWESYCSYDEEDGFTVTIDRTLKGTGVFWSRAIVAIRKGEPEPLRIESGGRGQEESKAKAYR
jgi:hypothetical protein